MSWITDLKFKLGFKNPPSANHLSLLLLTATAVVFSLKLSQVSSSSQDRYLSKPAIGRTAQLGFLYDERTDQFRDVYIFKEPIHIYNTSSVTILSRSRSSTGTGINKSSVTESETAAGLTNTYQEKFRLLNIDVNTAVNLLVGLLKVKGGSASFLLSEEGEPDFPDQVSGALLLKSETIKESLQIFYDELKSAYNLELLNSTEATHFVTGISWGSNFITSFKSIATKIMSKESEGRNLREIKLTLRSEFKKLQDALQNPNPNQNKREETRSLNFTISVQGDIDFPLSLKYLATKSEARSIGEVANLLEQVPQLIANTNGGKGVPLEFTLTPISVLRNYLKLSGPPHAHASSRRISTDVNEWVLKDIVNVFDEFRTTEQKILKLQEKLESHKICLLPEVYTKIKELHRSFLQSKTKFASKIQETLLQIRSRSDTTQSSSTSLTTTVEDYIHQDGFSPQSVETKLRTDFKEALKKIQLFILFQIANETETGTGTGTGTIEYIGFENNLQLRLLQPQNLHHVIYILFYKTNFLETNPEAWNENLNEFLATLKKPFNRLFILDCDFPLRECDGVNDTVIKQVINGRISIHDVLLELKLLQSGRISGPLIRMKALGRIAQIGELYDAATDTFLDKSIFSQPRVKVQGQGSGFKPWVVYTTNHQEKVDTFDIPSESFGHQLAAFDVDPEQQFSILADLFPLKRSGLYLAHALKKLGRMRSFCQTIHKGEWEINMSRSPPTLLVEALFPELLSSKVGEYLSGATHFAAKIQTGFNTVFSVEYTARFLKLKNTSDLNNRTDSDPQPESADDFLEEVATELNEVVQNMIDTGTHENLLESDNNTKFNEQIITALESAERLHLDLEGGTIQITVFSDLQGEQSQPFKLTNTDQLTSFLTKQYIRMFYPNDPESSMEPQPKPLAYVLYPIETLEHVLGFVHTGPHLHSTVTSTGEDPSDFASIFEQINSAESQIQRLVLEVNANMDCATDSDLLQLQKMNTEFKNTLGVFKKQFKEAVLQIKSAAGLAESNNNGNGNGSRLGNLRTNFYLNNYIREDGRYKELEKMKHFQEKVAFYKRLKSLNSTIAVKYLGRENEDEEVLGFNSIFTEESSEFLRIYLLYYKPIWTKEEEGTAQIWRENSQFFFGPLMGRNRNQTLSRFYIVDCEFNHLHCANMTQPTIHEYKNGKLRPHFMEAVEEEETDWQLKIHDIQNAVQENTNDIGALQRGKSLTCDFWNKIMSAELITLDCGGVVSLPPKGESIWLDYKSSQAYRNKEQCLWTFNNTNDGRLNGIKVKITLLCEGFGDSQDILSVLQWTPWTSVSLLSHQLKSTGQTEDYVSNMWVDGLYLSFVSNGFSIGKGFIIRLDVIGIYANRNTALRFSHTTPSGSASYGPYEKGSVVSITVSPQRAALKTTTTLTVDYLDSKTMGSCDHYDSLDIYKGGVGVGGGQRGVSTKLARLCGNITTPVSFSIDTPILALFFTDKSTTGKGFGLSWK